MRYDDSRFQLDKTFCFYANDFCQRRRANSNKGFLYVAYADNSHHHWMI